MKTFKMLQWTGFVFLGGMAVGYYGFTRSKMEQLQAHPRVAVARIENKVVPSIGTVPNPWNAASTDAELLGLARVMLTRSPQAALDWAQSCEDPELRRRLSLAVAQAWGEKDPASAVAWALGQKEDTLAADLKAVLAGAVRQPVVAVEIGRNLLAQNSVYAGTYGAALVVALDADEQFLTAVQFANKAPADFREDWTAAAARAWAQREPREALAALDAIVDEPLRDPIFRAVVQGWPAAQPADLANYALSLPTGEQRAYALDQVMFKWSRQDPAGLANWLANIPRGVNYDAGAFFIVTEAKPTNLSPATAMSWAESIGDHDMRLSSFEQVLAQWGQADPMAARNYVQQAHGLDVAERAQLLQSIPTQ